MVKIKLRIFYVVFAIILGLSNCGVSVWTAIVSACVGYTCADLSYWAERIFTYYMEENFD